MSKQLILWNCRSLSGKINSIQYYVDHLRKRHKPHALFFTEAWLDYNVNNNDTEYRSYKLQPFSHELFPSPSSEHDHIHGGIACYFYNHKLQQSPAIRQLAPDQYQSRHFKPQQHNSACDIVWFQMRLAHWATLILIGITYLPPNSDEYTFQSDKEWWTNNVTFTINHNPDASIILMGDFNSHHKQFGDKSTNARGSCLYNLTEDLDLQCINKTHLRQQPTHKQGHVLDLVFTNPNTAALIHNMSIIDDPTTFDSDHLPISITLNTPTLEASPSRLYI